MAKKKETDKLLLDMIQCEKDGFGVHYGRWKAMQNPVKVVKEEEIPEGWCRCQHCGRIFKPTIKRPQKFCDYVCRREAYAEKGKEVSAKYMRGYRERMKADGKD